MKDVADKFLYPAILNNSSVTVPLVAFVLLTLFVLNES
jgi:hypothetical protein